MPFPFSPVVMIFHLLPRIPEAANYKNHKLSAASYLIALEVSPPPVLSQNLSGSPLVTVQLRHRMVSSRGFALTPVLQPRFEHVGESVGLEKASQMARALPGLPPRDKVFTRRWDGAGLAELTLGKKAFTDVRAWTFLLDGTCPSWRSRCGGHLSLVLIVALSNMQRSLLRAKHALGLRVGHFSTVLSCEFLVLLGRNWNSVHIRFIIVHG